MEQFVRAAQKDTEYGNPLATLVPRLRKKHKIWQPFGNTIKKSL